MKPNDRILILGSTGSGKTTLAAFLSLNVERLAIFDVKRELQWLPRSRVVNDLSQMTFSRREGFQPPRSAVVDKDLFETFCARLFASGNCLLWLDEAAFVTSPNYCPPSLESILVAGRSSNVGCMALSQSGAGLSHPMLWRSAEHVFIGYANDRMIQSVVPFLGDSALAATSIDQYSGTFLAFPSNAKQPTVQSPIPINQLGANYREQR